MEQCVCVSEVRKGEISPKREGGRDGIVVALKNVAVGGMMG